MAFAGAGGATLPSSFQKRPSIIQALFVFCVPGVLAAGFRLGRVFPQYTAIVMTAVTCMFDSSTVVFMVRSVALCRYSGVS